MGRTPTPNALLKSRNSKKARKDEPVLTGGFGDPPHLMPEAAKETWRATASELEKIGIGSSVERSALECYCYAVEAFHQANRDIANLGSVVQSERGYTRNPACLNQNAAMSQILKFATQFGLTPASRGKLPPAPKKEDNPFDEF